MMTVRFAEFGEPAAVLNVEELPPPAMTEGQALVRITARPINPADLLTVRGRYGLLPQLPATPGGEAAGTIEDPGDCPLAPGDRVVLLGVTGTWQQYLSVDCDRLVKVPTGVDDDTAAQAFLNPLSAWAMLESLDAHPGQWLLQSAAGAALGRLVIQMARTRGLRTVNIIRRAGQESELTDLGADAVIESDGEGLVEAVREATGDDGVLFALDTVGGKLGGEMLRCLAPGGTMIVHGSLAGREPIPVQAGRFLTRSLTMRGFWLNEWLGRTPLAQQRQALTSLLDQFATGHLATGPVERWPLEDIVEAVKAAEEPGRNSKILLVG